MAMQWDDAIPYTGLFSPSAVLFLPFFVAKRSVLKWPWQNCVERELLWYTEIRPGLIRQLARRQKGQIKIIWTNIFLYTVVTWKNTRITIFFITDCKGYKDTNISEKNHDYFWYLTFDILIDKYMVYIYP